MGSRYAVSASNEKLIAFLENEVPGSIGLETVHLAQ